MLQGSSFSCPSHNGEVYVRIPCRVQFPVGHKSSKLVFYALLIVVETMPGCTSVNKGVILLHSFQE